MEINKGNNMSDFINNIKKIPEIFYIIHYSCQSLNDDNETLSPRITSIAVNHYATGQTISLSTHSIAEELRIDRNKVLDNLDKIEQKLLKDFYDFIRDRRDKYWIHWNMRNLNFGFEHIQHRYRILNNENNPPIIPIERRINLNDILVVRYGSNYAKHPKLTSLMECNGGRHRHFLTGEEEVVAFKNNEFIKMHNSTLCKVGFFGIVLEKMITGKLNTQSKSLGVKIDKLLESRTSKIIALISSFIGLISIFGFVLK